MTKLPNINLNISTPEAGLTCRVDLNLALLLPELQKRLGFDLQPMVVSLLLGLVRFQIKDLQKTIENKKILNWLTEADELELSKLKNDEAKLQIFTN